MRRPNFPCLALYILLTMPSNCELTYAFWNSLNEVLTNKK